MASRLHSSLKYGLAISLALIAPSVAHADVFTVDTWTGASIGTHTITGAFTYDATTNSVVAGTDTTAISGVCTSGTCGLSEFLPFVLNVGALPAESFPTTFPGDPKYIVLAGGLGVPTVPGINPITLGFETDFTGELTTVTGGLSIAPGPTPGEGLLSIALIFLMGFASRFRGLIV
jgi:hypothetical protein